MAIVICPECKKQLAVSDPARKFAICPYCGAQVRLNINVNYNFNYSKSEHTEHIVDEAKIKNADNVNRVIGIFATPFEERRAQKDHERQMEENQQRMLENYMRDQQQCLQEEKRVRKEKIMSGQYSFKEMLVDLMQSQQVKAILFFCIGVAILLGSLAWGEHEDKLKAHQAELDALEQEKCAAAHLAMNQAQIPEFDFTIDARTFVRDLKSRGFVNVSSEAVQDLVFGIGSKEYEIIEVLVDGAPDYSSTAWYPTDTDIVVRYHAYR